MPSLQNSSQNVSLAQPKPLFKSNKTIWRIYMAMLDGRGNVRQEGRFIKIHNGSWTKVYVIDGERNIKGYSMNYMAFEISKEQAEREKLFIKLIERKFRDSGFKFKFVDKDFLVF